MFLLFYPTRYDYQQINVSLNCFTGHMLRVPVNVMFTSEITGLLLKVQLGSARIMSETKKHQQHNTGTSNER